jgi:hypothetical protein
MAAKLTKLTQYGDTTAPSGRELYHLQFSLEAASPETFGYTLVYQTEILSFEDTRSTETGQVSKFTAHSEVMLMPTYFNSP